MFSNHWIIFIPLLFNVIHTGVTISTASDESYIIRQPDHQKSNISDAKMLELKSRRYSGADLTKFRQVTWCLHNQYRSKHRAPPLTISNELNNIAQNYAQILASTGRMVHSQRPGVGENLYASYYKEPEAEDVMSAWYDEIQFYDFNNPESNMAHFSKIGHFTQLVWKATREVGIGIAQQNGKFFVVANYRPPGNLVGSFGQNV